MASRRSNSGALGSALEIELHKLRQRIPSKLKRQGAKLARAGRWPFHECLIGAGWQEKMFAPLVVTRRRPDGDYAVGTFVVDLGCLGVKIAGAHSQLTRDEYTRLKRMAISAADGAEAITPQLAARVVEVGVFYALELGFAPAPEYFVAALMLADVDTTADTTFIPRGYNGKPFYVPGPGEDPEPVLAQLRGRCGPDGFTYTTA